MFLAAFNSLSGVLVFIGILIFILILYGFAGECIEKTQSTKFQTHKNASMFAIIIKSTATHLLILMMRADRFCLSLLFFTILIIGVSTVFFVVL